MICSACLGVLEFRPSINNLGIRYPALTNIEANAQLTMHANRSTYQELTVLSPI